MTDDQTIGRYRLLERVGRGGMGVVYRGVDTVLDREVAIKVMSDEIAAAGDEEARTRFFREARAAAKLQHRNIVTIFDFGEEGGTCYIAMEFLRGTSLAARMGESIPLPLARKLDIVSQLATGLDFAHQHGVVHRDVKPANIWLLEDGTVKLLDFGLARVSTSTLTHGGSVLGSAPYLSPEQIAGGPIDGRADIFSATVVLFELLAGQKPYEGETPTSTILQILQESAPPIESIVRGLPEPLVEAVAKGLQKNPSERFQTAGELAIDLQLIRMSLLDAGGATAGGATAGGATAGGATESGDDTLGEIRHAPAPRQPVADPIIQRTAAPTTRPRLPAPAASRRIWVGGLLAAAAIVTVVGWYAVTRQAAAGPGPAPPIAEPDPTLSKSGRGPAPPPAPRVLHVTSEPSGATILLDGRDTGLVTTADLPIGDTAPQQIRLVMKGFQSIDHPLTSDELSGGSVTLQMRRAATVLVRARGEYPFEIVVDGNVVKRCDGPCEVGVQAPRTVFLRNTDYLLNRSYSVGSADAPTKEITAPPLGAITIRGIPETCHIFLEGRDRGVQSVTLKLAAGRYRGRLNCDGIPATWEEVTVSEGVTGPPVVWKVKKLP